MRFYADLHIHSKYSRATSRDCDLEHLTYWGRKKGITVIGTGDFTHPAWFQEIKEKLIPAEPGLFRLRPDLEKAFLEPLPAVCHGTTRFMLSVEISTIYKKGDKTRKVHHLIYAPSIEKADAIRSKLGAIGNIRSDGRPILGLDSRHLLEIVLEAGEGCYLVPAHIWTPWFSVLGSKSGFDNVCDCYGDLSKHVFAVETGLSSDPEMNWRVSHLDRYRLMSNSDAHSPQKLGREVCVFDTDLDYFAMKRALETGIGYGGTAEFFPEEGKYHMDGHRNCNVRLTPEESRKLNGICPACKKPLTLGVMYRVEELADRPLLYKPQNACPYQNLIPLPEMISEIHGKGETSQAVTRDYEKMISSLGPELDILSTLPLDLIGKNSSPVMQEAIQRMREGQVIRDAGYDGEYGRIKLFTEDELKNRLSAGVLFNVEKSISAADKKKKSSKGKAGAAAVTAKVKPSSPEKIPTLDRDQAKALEITDGPLLILAGPGSGKTRTLTHRAAHLIQSGKAKPEGCLTITFTRRAAEEMRARLKQLLPEVWQKIPVTTFHGLGLRILSENRIEAGLSRGFRVAGEQERVVLLMQKLGVTEARAQKLLHEVSLFKRKELREDMMETLDPSLKILNEARDTHGWLDYDDLLILSVQLLEEDPDTAAYYRKIFTHLSIDEYQDIDAWQYKLVRLLAAESGNICVIGDPDQSIYSFRGANVEFFLHFERDFPGAQKIFLSRNYRSGRSILEASAQMIQPSSLAEDRAMEALLEDTGRVVIHKSPTDKAEAEFVVHTVEKLIGGTSFFSMDSGRSEGTPDAAYSFSDFAVLTRTDAQLDLMEEAFQRSGIPFQRQSHRLLDLVPEARALFVYLSEHVLSSGIKVSLKKGLSQCGLAEDHPLTLKLESWAETFGEDASRFLSEIHLSLEADIRDDRAEKVSLMTLHASKGLEFPVVFIAGCEDGLLPLNFKGKPEPEKIAEERRLFFVGMTRAKERLFLSHAEMRLMQGQVQEQSPSPFLKDIEERLLARETSDFKKKPSPTPQKDLF